MAKWTIPDTAPMIKDYNYKGTVAAESFSGVFVTEWTESGPVIIKDKSSGGPSSYYDMPFKEWDTTNDQMEYLAEHKWGKYGIHLKDIFKGLCRWGDKEGTTEEYDARKIVYYGLRVLRMLVGKKAVQEYLSELANDKQFKE